jgi:hypothetical protein
MSVTGTGTRGSRPGELHRRRVVLVAESAGLAGVLNHLLDPADRLSRLGSLRELADSRSLDSADVVVLDMPANKRAAALSQVRRRHLGPLIVVVDRGAGAARLDLDDACTPLARPFSAEELAAAMAVPRRLAAVPRPASPDQAEDLVPAAGDRPAATDPEAAARQAPVRPAPATATGQLSVVDRAQRLLVGLTQAWQARRGVRVAGFSAFALVAFTVAFALAAQGGCGPGCDALGTGFSPAPTIAPAEPRANTPLTTAPKRPTTSAAPPGTGSFRGISGGRPASTTSLRATATTDGPAVSRTTRPATTRPATTRPTTPPTTAPPTTAPPTTAPPTTAPPTTGAG